MVTNSSLGGGPLHYLPAPSLVGFCPLSLPESCCFIRHIRIHRLHAMGPARE